MSFKVGEKVINRNTREIFTVVSVERGLILKHENGDVARYCTNAFKKLVPSRVDISAMKKGLREYL
jgi:hypothetical protein